MDISTLAVEETAVIELDGPDGDELTNEAGDRLSITVYGPGSKRFVKAQAARNRAVMEALRKGTRKMREGEEREHDAEFLAKCTVAFNGFDYKGGSDYEAFKAAYLDPTIGFIAEQLNKAIGDWENFTKASPKT